MGSLSDLFLKYGDLLETAFDIDEAGDLIEKDASKVLEADSLFHDIFVSDVRAILKELAFDPHAPQQISTINPAMWSQEYPSWLTSRSQPASPQASPQPPMLGAPRQPGEIQPNRVVSKVRTSRPDLVHGNGSGPQATGTGPAYGTPRTGVPAFDPSAPAGKGGIPSGSGNTMSGQIVSILRGRGWSEPAIHGALANALAEGGLSEPWKQSTVRAAGPNGREESYGPWQFHRGGELDGYYKWAQQNGIKNPDGHIAGMTNYMAQQVEKRMPNYKSHTDEYKATDAFQNGFERPKNQTPGTRYGYVEQARPHLDAANQDIARNPGVTQYQQQQQQASQQQQQQPPSGLARYATGNAVSGGPSSVDRVHPEFSNRINNMVSNMPPDLAQRFQVISGFRDKDRERQVYQTQHQGQRIPTDSYHSHGMAVDINRDPQVQDWINKNGSKYGVGFTINHIPGEDNHLEPTENGQRIQQRQIQAWSQQNMPHENRTQVAQAPQPTAPSSQTPQPPPKPLAGSPQDAQTAVSKMAATTPSPQQPLPPPPPVSQTPPPPPPPPPPPAPSSEPSPQAATPPPPPSSSPPPPPPEEKVPELSSARRVIRPSQMKLAERHTRTAIGLLRGI